MWTLSAGEAEPPRTLRYLWGLDFLAYPAGVATFHYNQQVCSFPLSLAKAYRLDGKSGPNLFSEISI